MENIKTDGKYIIEYRALTQKPHQGEINLYIDEILLGSTVERTKYLFTPGTKVLSCFERNHVLYLNLSQDLLQMGEGVIEIREGIELLTKNFPFQTDVSFTMKKYFSLI